MVKNSLITKMLAIIGGSLFIGFAVMGSICLWLDFRETIGLQSKNNSTLASLIRRDIAEYMLKGNPKEIAGYIAEIKGKGLVLDMKLYNHTASEAVGSAPDSQVQQALTKGMVMEWKAKERGTHVLTSVIPLLNEDRCRRCHSSSGTYVGALVLKTSLDEGYASAMRLAKLLSLTGAASFICILFGMYFFFKKTIVKNVKEVLAKVEEIASGEGDLTKIMPIRSSDEIGAIAKAVADLTAKLRETVSSLYQQTGHIAEEACKTNRIAGKIVGDTSKQHEQSSSVAVAVEEIAATLNDVAANTLRGVQLAQEVDNSANRGMLLVQATSLSMENINESVIKTLSAIQKLEISSDKIGEIISIIEDIADQINLLALNAAIEAARAGDAGRGFAVVANEVKNLSMKTAASTKEISVIITGIQAETREAVTNIRDGRVMVDSGLANSEMARKGLEDILHLAGESVAMINQIAVATEEQSATTNEISSKILEISDTAASVNAEMEKSVVTSFELSERAENIYATVGKFKVGNQHDLVKAYATELLGRVTEALERSVASREISAAALWDRNYIPIPNTYPQKYHTAFDKFFDQVVSPIQEEIAARDSIVYAIFTDDTGYCPSHNLQFSKPLTGNRDIDLANNRTKRKFDDRAGIKATKNSEQYLLQTNMRDTGEIVNDIASPFMFQNRRWGTVRVGYKVAQ